METNKSILDWIDTQKEKMLEQLQCWSDMNSHTHNLPGLQLMSQELAKAFEVLDTKIELKEIPPYQQINSKGNVEEVPLGNVLYLQKRPEAERQVLLVIHMDTVFSVDHHFQKTELKDDKTLVGPGVIDAKGGIVVLLTALQAFESSSVKDQLGWQVIINSDEEIGSLGSKDFLKECAQKAQMGLVYEPSLPDGNLAGERKGSGNFVLIARGKSGHAGRDFDQGRNAIHALSKCIVDLYALNGTHDGLTVNMGKVEGGEAVNVIADLAILRFNVRLTKTEDQEDVIAKIKQITEDVSKGQDVGIEVKGEFQAPPKPIGDSSLELFHKVQECGKELGLNLEWKPTGGVCDGNRLASCGLATVDTLGVTGGNLHSDQEYLLIDSLTERAKLSALLLMKIANGGAK